MEGSPASPTRPSQKRSSSSTASTSAHHPPSPKKARPSPSLYSWLHPSSPIPLIAHSPPLHQGSSTFLSFTLQFTPQAHITAEPSLTKECKRIVRELDVCSLVSGAVMEAGEGAFQDTQGRAPRSGARGKERAREPDHRMWACRTLVLREGRDGTKGEDDYALLEAMNDDGEKYGGERVLRALKEGRGLDVLTVCCRWYGGEMIGPIRFQHIGLTATTSLELLLKMVALRDLRSALETLDAEVTALRNTLNPPGSPLRSIEGVDPKSSGEQEKGKYDEIDDIIKLERLVKAKEKTRESLEGRAGWVAMEQARAEEAAVAAAEGQV